jgi:hypothetical protein
MFAALEAEAEDQAAHGCGHAGHVLCVEWLWIDEKGEGDGEDLAQGLDNLGVGGTVKLDK